MVTLTHNMIRRNGGHWQCVDCHRYGTIAEINAVPCPKPTDVVLDAIGAKGKFAK
jgi:hypothetical protein